MEKVTTTPTHSTSRQGEYYSHTRQEILDRVPRDAKRILDVGCGAGNLGAAIKQRQPAEVHGIEIVPAEAAKASKKLDRVWICSIEKALSEIPDRFYDCIITADVLEHLQDPWDVLRQLRGKLTIGGKFVASVPNVQHWAVVRDLIEGKFEYQTEGILDRTHLRFFTRKSVEELFWSAGCRINQVGTTEHLPHPSEKLLNAIRRSGLSSQSLEQDGRTFQFLVEADVPLPSAPPKVAVVILNWNGKQDTLECLASVIAMDYPSFQVAVVDNGSTDGSVDAICQAFSQVTVLETGANLGYAGGNNVGIRWALEQGFDGILILNNDTVVDRGLLRAFASAQQQFPSAGVFGAKIYYYTSPDVLWFAGGKWHSDNLGFKHVGQGHPDGPEFSVPRTFDYMTGCALYAPAEVFRRVGFFGEELFLTFEETDWCYRASAMGFSPIYVPDARLWHKVSVSFGGAVSPLMTYFMTRNRLLFVRRHMPAVTLVRLLSKNLRELRNELFPHPKVFLADTWLSPRRLYWALVSYRREVLKRAHQPQTQARLLGLKDFLLGHFGNCPEAVRTLSKAPPVPAPRA